MLSIPNCHKYHRGLLCLGPSAGDRYGGFRSHWSRTTKLGELETRDDILRRIDEAAKFMPLDQMALSPQCGFSSTVHGNDIAVEQQAANMRLVIDIAREIWGSV